MKESQHQRIHGRRGCHVPQTANQRLKQRLTIWKKSLTVVIYLECVIYDHDCNTEYSLHGAVGWSTEDRQLFYLHRFAVCLRIWFASSAAGDDERDDQYEDNAAAHAAADANDVLGAQFQGLTFLAAVVAAVNVTVVTRTSASQRDDRSATIIALFSCFVFH